MNKLYNLIIWHNDTTPAVNESNLNAMSEALDNIDDRVIELGGYVLETVPQIQDLVSALEELSQNPPYIGANGNWYVFNTNTEQYEDSGVDASISVTIADVTALAPDEAPYVTNTGTDTDPIFHLFIPRGQTGQPGQDGDDGNGIVSITKTSSSGLVDTYTILYTDGNTDTFTVTNGSGGASALSQLTDVSLTDLSANQFLRYNATTQKWENFSLSAASSSNMGLIKLGAGLTVNQQGATDVDLTTTTYDNTTSGLSATTAKGAIDENAADITNKHKITQKAVDITSGWTQDSTSQSGSTFYKKQITLNHIYVDSPTVEIGAYNAVLPTTAQQTTYDYLRYVTVDDTVPCIYLYADENMMSDSDRTSFYIDITGVD